MRRFSLTRTWAIAKKELIQIRRDRLSLALAFLLPAILLFIFGYAITFDVDRITTVVYDMDKSRLSRDLISNFTASRYFSVVGYPERYKDIDEYLDAGKARAALVIPIDFGKKIETRKAVQVQVILDGSDSNTATIAMGYVTAISRRFESRLSAVKFTPLVEARSRVWYNPELKSRNFIVPGLIAVIMAVIIALLTSLTISKEWDRGTMEQLISTPLKTPELIIGKLIPYFLIGFADTIIAVLIGTLLFEVPLRGSLLLLLLLSGIFLFGGLSFGILISVVARNQLLASQMAMLSSFLPAFMLSGFVFAISNMPDALQLVTYIVPARYFVTILKGVFLKGSGLDLLWLESILLTVFAAAVFAAANRSFKKRIE